MKLGEKGFIYIELIVAMTIATLVVTATTMAIFQVMKNSERNSNHITAIGQVQNAGSWISRDTQMAQSVTTDGLPSPDFLVISWTDGDSGDEWQVVYTLENMSVSGLKKLMRNQSINGGENISTLVAQYIDPDSERTKCQFVSGTLSLTITAAVGNGSNMESESRTYQLVPRSS
jgi:type II secretory pathway pseudopilin PulG